MTWLLRAPYRLGWRHPVMLDVPVVVVGNLIAGGAGKTPTVLEVVRLLQQRGHRPGIVSRGYGRSGTAVMEVRPGMAASECGDEPLLLRLRGHVPVVVGKDRVAAVQALRRGHPAIDVVVSDDGLQHLALDRQAQVIVFDERGAGNGWLLPAGPLRERLARQVPPRTLVVYNAAAASTPWPGTLARRSLTGAVGLEDWWSGASGSATTLRALQGRPLLAAAGVAHPRRFFDMLRERGLVFDELALPDHHDYSVLPWPAGAQDVIVTEKDAIKLSPARMGNARVWVAPLDFALDDTFAGALAAWLPLPGDPRHANSPA